MSSRRVLLGGAIPLIETLREIGSRPIGSRVSHPKYQ